MREVLPRLLWIGNARDARDIAAVLQREIQAVVDLAAEEPAIVYPREIIYCRLPMMDGDGNSPGVLRTAIDAVAHFIKFNVPTLVACSMGMSRSPAITAAALQKAYGESANLFLRRLAQTGPHDISPALWQALRNLERPDEEFC